MKNKLKNKFKKLILTVTLSVAMILGAISGLLLPLSKIEKTFAEYPTTQNTYDFDSTSGWTTYRTDNNDLINKFNESSSSVKSNSSAFTEIDAANKPSKSFDNETDFSDNDAFMMFKANEAPVKTKVVTYKKNSDGNFIYEKTDDVINEYESIPETESEEDSEKTTNTTEEKVNKDEVLTKENFEASKKIIEKRLEAMEVTNYDIRQNTENGQVIVELQENDDTDRVVGNLYLQGKVEIKDKDTNEVLINNDDIDYVNSGYLATNSGTTVICVDIQFNKDGTEKFKNITNKYVEEEKTVQNENGEDTTEKVTKEIVLELDGEKLLTTHFEEENSKGLMRLTFKESETTKELKENYIQANSLAAIIGSGKMPIVYKTEQNKFIFSDINQNQINIIVSTIIIIVTIGIIYLIVKNKEKGILAGISLIGYVALLLLAIRYANVEISIQAIFGIALCTILNYIMSYAMVKKENVMEAIKNFAVLYIPVLIISVVFTFANITMGPVLFWGIAIMLLYNVTVTKLLLK